jgi:NADH:ubiquinone oxidoreductase subunit F (NADH-binding)
VLHLHSRRVHEPILRVEAALKECYAAGILGKNAMGTGKTINIYVHRGAGAYICGEETAMMNSIEGRRGNPRIKPPFPAVSGVFAQPTTINNVETLAAVPHIINHGAAWYKQWMRADNPKSTGTKLYSVCGNVQRPGNYEVAMGFPFKDFMYDLCGGPLPGRKFRAIIPGGISVPIQTLEEAEASLMDYEGFVAQGHDARVRWRDSDRRPAEPREADRARGSVFRARELRPMHAVPRRHRVDDEDSRANRRRRWDDGRSGYPIRNR